MKTVKIISILVTILPTVKSVKIVEQITKVNDSIFDLILDKYGF